jgi:hypothetical protein
MKNQDLENIFDELRKTIKEFKNSESIKNIIDNLAKLKGKEHQKEKKEIVTRDIQNVLKEMLALKLSEIKWGTECTGESKKNIKESEINKDAVDIFGEIGSDSIIIIEIDAHRSDQVAKKFLSRHSKYYNKNLIFVSICYFGTRKMSWNECKKYHKYCEDLTKNILNCGSFQKKFHYEYLFDKIDSKWN